MAIDLSVRTLTLAGSDHSWLASAFGTNTGRSVTLDLSTFDFATTFTSKMVPSGVVLGKITASGLYGPYSDAAGDGRTTATGFLLTDVDVADFITDLGSTTLTGKKVLAPMIIQGIIREAKLPTGHGLDAAAKVNLLTGAPGLFQFV